MSELPPELSTDAVIEDYKKDIDRTLLRESLKRTPEERARTLMALQRAAQEFREAGRRAFGAERHRICRFCGMPRPCAKD